MHNKKGQALLMLLVFVVIGITVTSAAVALTMANSLNAQKFADGTIAYQVAESGAENALLRLLRNPFYTGETSMWTPWGTDASVNINVTGANPYTITSTGKYRNFQRKIQVIANNTGKMEVVSWKEIY